MNRNRANLVWGIVLILFGSFYLLQTLGFVPELAPIVWGGIFAVTSLIFLVLYLMNGWQAWGWLFPTSIFAGLAIVLFLADRGAEGAWIGALFLASVGLPFWLAFAIDRKANWWALIPGWVFAVLTAVVLLSETVSGELIGSLVMFGIGLPFLAVYLLNRANWWALIPAAILCGLGVLLLFVNQAPETWIGAFVLLMISLPFLFVFVRVPKQWWAIIPGGIMLTLAIVTLLAGAVETESWGGRLLALVAFWGTAVPFIYLWLRREVYPTDWAKYPAAALLLLGVVAPFVEEVPGGMLAIVLILVGGWLLLDAARHPKLKG